MSHVPGPHDKITTDVVHNSVRADQLAERREKKSRYTFKIKPVL